jgi:tRNA 2-thiocytidine biosynthesis protein TtcA
MEYPIIPCNLCGSQGNLQRQKIREMMADWDRRYPGRTEAVFSALQNVVPSHLADTALFDFKGLRVGAELGGMDGGDTVFDGPQFGVELTLPEMIPLQPLEA